MKNVIDAIEAARLNKTISNEAAQAATICLSLKDDDAVLANRLLAMGSDPFSIEFVATGKVSEHIRLAHYQGPGSLSGKERQDWLNLASLSIDESAKSTLLERVEQFCTAVAAYKNNHNGAAALETKILNLPFTLTTISGFEMRLYTSDLGFASAYWNDQPYAAVQCDGYIAIGSSSIPLETLGIKVDKSLSPTFGLIFPPKE